MKPKQETLFAKEPPRLVTADAVLAAVREVNMMSHDHRRAKGNEIFREIRAAIDNLPPQSTNPDTDVARIITQGDATIVGESCKHISDAFHRSGMRHEAGLVAVLEAVSFQVWLHKRNESAPATEPGTRVLIP